MRTDTAYPDLRDLPIGRRMLTDREAAEYIGMSVPYLRNSRWKGVGGPPYVKIGSSVRYRLKDLDAWLERHLVRLGKAEREAE